MVHLRPPEARALASGELTIRKLHREPVGLEIVGLDEVDECPYVDLADLDHLGEYEALEQSGEAESLGWDACASAGEDAREGGRGAFYIPSRRP